MPGTGSRGPSAKVQPPRMVSPKKGDEERKSATRSRNARASSRIGSACSVASTVKSEKDAAGLITDLMSLKQITHDDRIVKHNLPHRQAIGPDEIDEYLQINDGQYITEVPADQRASKPVSRISRKTQIEDAESDLDDLEDVFGDDMSNEVSSIGTNSEDEEGKFDTDLEDEVEGLLVKTFYDLIQFKNLNSATL